MSIYRGVDQEDVIHIHNRLFYSAIKRNEILAFLATWMDLETIMLSEVTHTMRPTSDAFTDMWNLKKGQTKLLCRTDADSQTLKNLWSPEKTVWGVGRCTWLWDRNDFDDHYTTTDVINSFE